MGLYSVERYCKNLINGTVMPAGVPGPLEAWITPPVAEKLKAPKAYVWGGHVASGRQSAPRGLGLKKRPWVIDVWLGYMDTPDDALANEPFAQVIDAVLEVFETATMPVFIDAKGNVVSQAAATSTASQIQAVGESWVLDYPPEKTVVSLRQVWYSAHIGMDVLEVIQR